MVIQACYLISLQMFVNLSTNVKLYNMKWDKDKALFDLKKIENYQIMKNTQRPQL